MDQKIENQNEKIEALLELVAKHPDLRIMPVVESEIVADDGYAWWSARWGNATVEEVWNDDEKFYIRSNDEEELIESEMNNNFHPDLPYEEASAMGKEVVDAYEWEKVIIVYIRTV